MEKRIYLSSPTMNGHEMEYINEAFETNWIAPLGKNVDEFENELAKFVGISHAAALSSGSAAIHLAVKLCDVKQNDVVLCSSLTFSASANPVTYETGKLVFVDSETDTWNMDPQALRKALEKYPHAKAVILVNLYGVPAKLEEIQNICKEYNVPLIEDAAESLSATYKGKQTGTFGKYGIFSFNGNKIITTSGGGMLVSDNKEAIEKARFWATQAREKARYYEHKEIGYNYRMSNIVAGIGRGQLLSLEEFKQKKREIYFAYKKAFEDMPEIKMNPFLEYTDPNFWLSCMQIDANSTVSPLDIIIALEKENIESRPIWKPLHMQPVFKENDFIQAVDGVSNAQTIYEHGVCLPSDVKNTEEDMEKIISIIRKCFDNADGR